MTATNAHDPAGDTLFGVCAAIGRDFGVDPLWLRLAFAISFLASPTIVAGSYFALGAVVVLARLAAPRRRRPAGSVTALPVAERAELADLPLAA